MAWLGVEKFAIGDFLGYGSRGENHHLLHYFDGSKLEVHNWTYWYRMVELDANGGLKIKQVNSTNKSWVLTNQQYHQQKWGIGSVLGRRCVWESRKNSSMSLVASKRVCP